MINAVRQIFILSIANFQGWRRRPQIWLAFGLGFVACFMLTNKSVLFAEEHGTLMQLFEPFIWTFGDTKSILLISLCLLLLFGDMPQLGAETPFMLIRTTRKRWMTAQILYIILATVIFTAFILLSTCLLSYNYVYPANQWSETAAILSYSNIGESIAIPTFVKVLELNYPYTCTAHIFLLLLGYSLVLSSLIFLFNLMKARLGMIAGVLYSGFGLFLTPDVISKWFDFSLLQSNRANIIFGWLSPLNHATYYMHSFGYDNLPKLWMSYLIFDIASLIIFVTAFILTRNYAFHFTGTEV